MNALPEYTVSLKELEEKIGRKHTAVYDFLRVNGIQVVYGNIRPEDASFIEAHYEEQAKKKEATRVEREKADARRLAKMAAANKNAANKEKEFDQPWQTMFLEMTERGTVAPTLANAGCIIRHDTQCKGRLIRNAMSGEILVTGELPLPTGAMFVPECVYPRPLTDLDVIQTRMWLSSTPYRISIPKADVLDIIEHVANENSFHPVQDYLLRNCVHWDGKKRIDTWLIDYLGAKNETIPTLEYLQRAGRYWLMSAVARIMEPGCQADHVLVLEGKQGIGKSSAARILAKDTGWYFGGLIDLLSKESAMLIRGKWIVEFPELGGMRRADSERVKEFFTTHTDKIIPKYSNVEKVVPRQCVFIATVNSSQYLSDPTGNRRFWPVECLKIDLEALERDVDQLWAEAYLAYRERFDCMKMGKEQAEAGVESHHCGYEVCHDHRWWPTEDEQQAVFCPQQGARVTEDVWCAAIWGWMRERTAPPTTSEVLLGALGLEVSDQSEREQFRAMRVLRNLGFVSTRTGGDGAEDLRVYRWSRGR